MWLAVQRDIYCAEHKNLCYELIQSEYSEVRDSNDDQAEMQN